MPTSGVAHTETPYGPTGRSATTRTGIAPWASTGAGVAIPVAAMPPASVSPRPTRRTIVRGGATGQAAVRSGWTAQPQSIRARSGSVGMRCRYIATIIGTNTIVL